MECDHQEKIEKFRKYIKDKMIILDYLHMRPSDKFEEENLHARLKTFDGILSIFNSIFREDKHGGL